MSVFSIKHFSVQRPTGRHYCIVVNHKTPEGETLAGYLLSCPPIKINEEHLVTEWSLIDKSGDVRGETVHKTLTEICNDFDYIGNYLLSMPKSYVIRVINELGQVAYVHKGNLFKLSCDCWSPLSIEDVKRFKKETSENGLIKSLDLIWSDDNFLLAKEGQVTYEVIEHPNLRIVNKTTV